MQTEQTRNPFQNANDVVTKWTGMETFMSATVIKIPIKCMLYKSDRYLLNLHVIAYY